MTVHPPHKRIFVVTHPSVIIDRGVRNQRVRVWRGWDSSAAGGWCVLALYGAVLSSTSASRSLTPARTSDGRSTLIARS